MRCTFLLVCLALASGLAAAQNTPQWELFGGYQYTRYDTGSAQTGLSQAAQVFGLAPINLGSKLNLTGWDASVEQNANHWLGGILDFSGSYRTKNALGTPALVFQFPVPTVPLEAKVGFYTFMGGPQFTLRNSSKLQPFARALFGGAYSKLETSLTQNAGAGVVKSNALGFAMGAGGGIDFHFSRRLAIRAAGDYIQSYLAGENEGNFRASVGVVFRIGAM